MALATPGIGMVCSQMRPGPVSTGLKKPSQQLILHALDLLDVDGDGALEAGDVTGVDNELLTGLQLVLDQLAVNLAEAEALAADALHDEALAAKQACAELLVEEDVQVDTALRGQEGALLKHPFLAGGNLDGHDLAREAGAKGNHARATLCGVDVLEHALTGEGLGEHLADAAALGLHLHVGGHPGHGALFGDHGLAGCQLADDDGERTTLDLVLHDSSFDVIGTDVL